MKSFILALVTLLCFVKQGANAECKGKVDLGAVYLKVDVIESGKTDKTVNMGGLRGDAAILFYKGFCFKPNFIAAWGKENDQFYTGSLAIGHYIPINEQICLLPTIGFNAFEMRSTLKIRQLGVHEDYKEQFNSTAPFIGLDITYTINDAFLLTAVLQYAWSRTNTHVDTLFDAKGHSAGPNLGLLLDYTLNKCWSINAGFGYNSSLSKEKHGLRVVGGKVGIAYWF